MKLIRDLPFIDYCALPGLHFSTLKHMATSPLHYRRARDHERRDTAALRLGRLAHALILTPDAPSDVAIYPGKVRRGKAWEVFEEEHAGKLIVRADEIEGAERMREAVWDHAPARDLISEGDGEVSLTWARHDAALRGRLDWLGPRGVVDVKTTSKIDARMFQREVVTRAYHAQLAFYANGVEAITGEHNPPTWIIAVESSSPFDVVVWRIDQQAIAEGWRTIDGWIKRVIECEETGRWPGVGGNAPVDFVLPDWAYAQGQEVTFGGVPIDEMGGGFNGE